MPNHNNMNLTCMGRVFCRNLLMKKHSPMKSIVPLILLVLFSGCGSSLSEEQRKAYREKIEINKIVRVSEIEITEAAVAEGRAVIQKIDSLATDSIRQIQYLTSYPGRITYVVPGEPDVHPLERRIMEAYSVDTTGAAQENIQNVRDQEGVVDTLLYSKPVIEVDAEGKSHVVGVWNVWIPKKEIVLDITRER